MIVPQTLHSQVLKSLHANHPGITRMKAIARSYFWWIGQDKAIEELGKSCQSCQANQANPAAAPLHPWIWPDTPWNVFMLTLQGHTWVTCFYCCRCTLKVARSRSDVNYYL